MKDFETELREKLVDLVEERFPKGNKERGNATVMMALFFAEVLRLYSQEVSITMAKKMKRSWKDRLFHFTARYYKWIWFILGIIVAIVVGFWYINR